MMTRTLVPLPGHNTDSVTELLSDILNRAGERDSQEGCRGGRSQTIIEFASIAYLDLPSASFRYSACTGEMSVIEPVLVISLLFVSRGEERP
jgi:hypothetical protein